MISKRQHLTALGRALAHRLKPQSASSRNVLKLAGGTAGSQVITVATAPILTRLYGPESFGVLAAFASILALLNVVSSLRYELAIAVPEDDDDAVALVWLCFALVAISTGLTALGVLLLGDQLVGWLNEPALKPLLWLLPVGVLLSGVYQPLSYWAIRRKQFGLLAQTKFRQSIFGVATSLAAVPLGTIGLLLGQIVSQSAGFIDIYFKSATSLKVNHIWTPNQCPHKSGDHEKPCNKRANIANASKDLLSFLLKPFLKRKKFALASTTAGLINSLGTNAPILILSSRFGTSLLGEFGLISKIIGIPTAIIASSIAMEFLSRAAILYRENALQRELLRKAIRLLLFSVVFCGLLAMATPLLPGLFGGKWQGLPIMTFVLMPRFVGVFVVSSLSSCLAVPYSRRYEVIAQSAQAFTIISGSLIGTTSLNPIHGYIAYSISSLIGYALFFALMCKASSYSLSPS